MHFTAPLCIYSIEDLRAYTRLKEANQFTKPISVKIAAVPMRRYRQRHVAAELISS
jgi:glutamate synthase domain-containing protein 2